MTISMDKKYRTRDGRDVRLLCVDGPLENPICGLVSGGDIPLCWRSDGAYISREHPLDLIEYHEPDIRTIWVNVYEDGLVGHSTEKSAKVMVSSKRAIAIAQPVTFEVKRNT